MNNPFDGAVAIVTGAGAGIGLALSRALAGRGATVVMTDIDGDRVTTAAAELSSAAAEIVGVTDAEAVAAVIERARARHGAIDYLFNNAGINVIGEALHHTLDDWQRVLDIDLRGVVHGVHAAYPIMVEQGHGHIVNIASTAALVPAPHQIAYATAKHAVLGLSTTLRAEAIKYGVRVSVVCPGFIATDMGQTQELRGVDRDAVLDSVPVSFYSAERCAHDTLRGVAKNKELIYITRIPKWLHRARRWFPRITSSIAARVAKRGLENRRAK